MKDRKRINSRDAFPAGRRQLPAEHLPPPTQRSAVGDTYLGENTTESLLLAVNEFREFLTFYPTNPRADYAQ